MWRFVLRGSSSYLGRRSEIVTSFSEETGVGSWPLVAAASLVLGFPPGEGEAPGCVKQKAGLEGVGMAVDVEWVSSMRTTSDASGLAFGFSWTHSSPICTQLSASLSA